MKESKLIEMKNKVDAVVRVTQHLLNEITQVKDLAKGTLETIKQMDDYEQAIEDLKKKMAEESSKAEEANASGKTIE